MVLSVLALFSVVRILADLAYDLLATLGRSGAVLAVQSAWLACLLALMPISAARSGIAGVAGAHLLVGTVVVLPAFLLALRRAGLPSRPLLRACARPAVAALSVVCTSLALGVLVRADGLVVVRRSVRRRLHSSAGVARRRWPPAVPSGRRRTGCKDSGATAGLAVMLEVADEGAALLGDWSDLLVYFAGTAWDGVRGTDRHMAQRLSGERPVLYVIHLGPPRTARAGPGGRPGAPAQAGRTTGADASRGPARRGAGARPDHAPGPAPASRPRGRPRGRRPRPQARRPACAPARPVRHRRPRRRCGLPPRARPPVAGPSRGGAAGTRRCRGRGQRGAREPLAGRRTPRRSDRERL